MLFCMGAGALAANGASGPLAALLTLLLPPEIKSFALSVHEFAAYLLAPIYGVVMGVGLQVCPLLMLFICGSTQHSAFGNPGMVVQGNRLERPLQSRAVRALNGAQSCCTVKSTCRCTLLHETGRGTHMWVLKRNNNSFQQHFCSL